MTGRGDQSEGVHGLKRLGCKEMSYRILFVATSVQHCDQRTGKATTSTTTNSSGSNNMIDQSDTALSSFIIPTSELSVEDSDYDSPDTLNLSESEKTDILRMHATPQLYNKLVESFCPSVFGHLEVKRGVLLMLFGGVHKKTPEGISLRGDLNVCIVGDPSCAKSQFLKYVHGFLPRTVYTSGGCKRVVFTLVLLFFICMMFIEYTECSVYIVYGWYI